MTVDGGVATLVAAVVGLVGLFIGQRISDRRAERMQQIQAAGVFSSSLKAAAAEHAVVRCLAFFERSIELQRRMQLHPDEVTADELNQHTAALRALLPLLSISMANAVKSYGLKVRDLDSTPKGERRKAVRECEEAEQVLVSKLRDELTDHGLALAEEQRSTQASAP